MRIGELARLAGTSPRALRYYEEHGLLPARRMSNGYRDYDAADLRAVEEIRARVAEGFALAETRPFVECLRAGHGSGDACPDSIDGYRRRIAEIDDEVARLLQARERLAARLESAHRAGGAPPAPMSAEASIPGPWRDFRGLDASAERPGCALFPPGAQRDNGPPGHPSDRPETTGGPLWMDEVHAVINARRRAAPEIRPQ
ncbi:MerR family transcriptional regulator [Parafrankia sp. EUN1f]|uniref:MerR family transcriptional regulator n=1 Tax=Parafrankia sp. EUN1f TaxID=102897 RepID=UPI0001C439DB|nr:MerR family transcriptional regulator [Parafrankia sp. EUN1f]EFC85444.1 transcriptional regulator, MerR family [Parafrankia sp. EUN1f]